MVSITKLPRGQQPLNELHWPRLCELEHIEVFANVTVLVVFEELTVCLFFPSVLTLLLFVEREETNGLSPITSPAT